MQEELLRWFRCEPKPSRSEIRSHDQDPPYAPGNATLVAVGIAKYHHDLSKRRVGDTSA